VSASTLAVLVACGAIAAAIAILLSPHGRRGAVAGLTTAMLGALVVALGAATLTSGFATTRLGWLFPLAGAVFGGDATSGLFIVVTGAVAVAAGLFTIGYARRGQLPAVVLAALPIFVAAMAFVPLAASVTTFLATWELMALTSLVLVLAEYRTPETRRAAVIYAVTTHLGFVAILLGLTVFAATAHSETFAAMSTSTLPSGVRSVVFALTVIGFGSKAGLIPLHTWLPHAHPAAPSPASALMSAAMVNLGIYGLVRVDIGMLGPGPRWWGLLLLAVGGLTAVYAVLQASVASDLKRLLAYSTSENMGLVAVALGAAMLLTAAGNRPVAQVAMAAGLLHVINHAAFKTLGFLAAGSVLDATGVGDLDALGGLATRMPMTTLMFGIAALGGAGLPLGAGFVSKWLLLQSLIHTLPASGTLLPLVMPLAVGAVALTAGLAVAAMVKAFGIGFLARPRSDEAALARESPSIMRVAMALPAVACAVLAVAPAVATPLLRGALATFGTPSGGRSASPSLGVTLRLPGIAGSMSPGLLAVTFVAATLAASAALGIGRSGRRPDVRPAALWSGGGGALTPRMQYTATSFAEPLQRVFDDVLRPDVDIDITHHAESRYLVEKVSYRTRVVDTIEASVYEPLLRWLSGWANLVRRAHSGSVHAYLAFGALGLIVALVVAR
jgi:hydrogenase-4 component B